MRTLTSQTMASLIKPRLADSHKGNYGHAFIIAGSKGRMGAAVLAASACLRSGAGLLTVCVPEHERFILQSCVPEAMLIFRESDDHEYDHFTSAGIGPAIGTKGAAIQLLDEFLQHYKKPMLLDADALTILSIHPEWWERLPSGSVLTPHPKEFDRMFGQHGSVEERINKAISLSKQFPWTIVLKGHRTLVTSNGDTCLNTTGNAGLAKGGSGDVLTGIITGLLAQGYTSFEAAQIGVYLHGLSADIAVGESQSLESLLAGDVVSFIGQGFKKLRIAD